MIQWLVTHPWLLVAWIAGALVLFLVGVFLFVKVPDARRTFDRIVAEEHAATTTATATDAEMAD